MDSYFYKQYKNLKLKASGTLLAWEMHRLVLFMQFLHILQCRNKAAIVATLQCAISISIIEGIRELFDILLIDDN